MTLNSYSFLAPFLRQLQPETAHNLTLKLLKTGFAPKQFNIANAALKVSLWNIEFPNPVGLAAGFDKNAEAIDELFGMGFGFVEVGTVTPKPQNGSAKPRLFRLEEDQAIINRMGFNNRGLAYAHGKIMNRRNRAG